MEEIHNMDNAHPRPTYKLSLSHDHTKPALTDNAVQKLKLKIGIMTLDRGTVLLQSRCLVGARPKWLVTADGIAWYTVEKKNCPKERIISQIQKEAIDLLTLQTEKKINKHIFSLQDAVEPTLVTYWKQKLLH